MPGHIGEHKDCNGFAVIKDSDGSVAGCHETEEKAEAQLAALYASEKPVQKQEVAPPDECVCPKCGYKTSKERGVPCRSVPCSECGTAMEGALDLDQAIKEKLTPAAEESDPLPAWKSVAKQLIDVLFAERGHIVWKSADGARWYLAIVSKAVLDRENEIVRREAMDYSIKICKKYDLHSKLYVQHLVPETACGWSVREKRLGPYWLELGRFDDSWLADAVYGRLQRDEEGLCRLSAGFIAPKEQTEKGVYTSVIKYDTSVVLHPACPGTALISVGGMSMLADVMKLLAPKDADEEARYEAALRTLLTEAGATTKMVESVTKAADASSADEDDEETSVADRFKALIAKCGDNESMIKELKALQGAVVAKAPVTKKAEKEEDEEEVVTKTKVLEAIVPDPRIDQLLTAVEGLVKGFGALRTEVSGLQEGQVVAKALAAAVARWPEEQAIRPTAAATTADTDEVEALMKSLGKTQDVVRHPFADFAGAPNSNEGGL